ncbi:prolyl oligopeptidase family serine peptidase [Pseudooceanicola sp. CBS1P-1]|uniref:Prolyl oligopeptidase family serine peptidase n=1 Tax=Pseudooceanicola albus TaxID=2692189 RepID=A0A6L7FYQ5_9RHOB|nr:MULTISPECIES: alpha/beta hydrolase-fold protein [Pseudooceanicola]MBT9382256.1 prolyl oligopeptidase family serine peptidase [Pseudooceanicola endophyticus]MXN16799.1 prolyl oligopeptidase family serine peptidase [Pseudooceanicola albus]
MILTRRAALLSALACLPCGPLWARPDDGPAPYPLFDTPPESHVLDRWEVQMGARRYRLFRALPKAAPPAGGWPSLWMLDGNAAFSALPRDLLAAHPGLAIVGIGYPIESRFDGAARAYDFLPADFTDRAGRATGGDRSFRRLLRGPLRRAVEEDLPFDPDRRSLWGHSYGGLFTLSTLLETPEAFAGWVAVSPSVYAMTDDLQGLARRSPLGEGACARLLIELGDHEQHEEGAPHGRPVREGPAPLTLALAETLGHRPDIALKLKVLPGLTHGQTFAGSFPDSLALAATL